jgi:hypothetical protein
VTFSLHQSPIRIRGDLGIREPIFSSQRFAKRRDP